MAVPARVSLATLGVADVGRAASFYRALGWRESAASVEGVVSFFHTDGGLLAVYGDEEMADEVGLPRREDPGFRGTTLAVNCDSPAEVDTALEAAVAAGGELLRPGRSAEWGGYSGYFADPDGHVWEVAHNPAWPIVDGRPELP